MRTLFDSCRPLGRLSYFALALVVALLTARLDAQGPQLTPIVDTLYRPDGTPAAGAILIRWQNFTTADNKAVPAGTMNVTIGAGGAIALALAPNAGATPAGSYYVVTYQLSDGTHAEEYWSVPATGPATVAAIRSRIVPAGVAVQVVSRQYVDDQLALKAADANVVHKSGAETVTGVKTFSASPVVPAPANPGDAATKAYVDANAGGGAPDWANITNKPSFAGFSGMVNVVEDCGAVGDNVTDDYAAIQACINNNPGRHLIFPKVRPSNSGGGTATNCDYYVSQQLVMKGNAQWLEGALPANWSGAACLRFPTGVGGIRVPSDAYSAKISNLELLGPACWSSGTLTTFEDWRGSEAALLQGSGPDGIQLLGGEPRLENVTVNCFQRHGIYISGDSSIMASPPSQPDFWRIDRVMVNSNRGAGIYANGGDSNAGVGTMLDARSNAIFGVQDNSPLGNTWIGVGTHTNHRDAIFAGTTQALTSCSVAANVMTCTTSAPLANNINVAGTWVTTAGQADSTFNTTCRVTAFNPGAQTVTCTFTHADGATTGGTIGTAASASVYNAWAAGGIEGGCIGGSDIRGSWIQPYIEANQGIGALCVRFAGNGTFILGGNADPVTAGSLSAGMPTWITTGSSATHFGAFGAALREPRDQPITLSLRAGATARQAETISFADHLGNVKHQLQMASTNFLGLKDATDNAFWLSKVEGGNVSITGATATEDVLVNQYNGQDFRVLCGTGSTNCFKVAKSDLLTYVNGVKSLGANPASAGFVSMASAEAINFRNNANSGDVNGLRKDAGDVVQVGGSPGMRVIGPLTSTVATGTAPLSVTSTTPVANLALASDTQLPAISSAGKVADSALSANVQLKAERNAASGYAGLDAGAKLAAAQLPNPSASTPGGVQSKTCTGADKLSAIGTDGVPVCSADQTSAGGGDAISVNGSAATDADFDDATPAAPANSINVRWQKDAAAPNNLSANVPYGSGLAVASGNLSVSLATCEAYRASDLTLTANTYADNVSCSLAAGTWLITSETTVKSPSTTAQKVTVKLWDGATVYGASEEAAPSQGAGATGYVSISLSRIVTLASTTTVKTSVASTTASILDATPDDNGSGTTNTANALHAVRIGN